MNLFICVFIHRVVQKVGIGKKSTEFLSQLHQIVTDFYRAMLYAERGIVTASRLSVCL